DEKVRAGASREDAVRAARIELGGVEQVKESVRDARAGAWIDVLWQDIRYGVRTLRRSPSFAAVTILTLAIGIAANSLLFSVVDPLLLRALPYQAADRLVYVSEFWPHELPVRSAPSPDLDNWRAEGRLFDAMEAYGGARTFTLTGTGEPERIPGTLVTAGFL